MTHRVLRRLIGVLSAFSLLHLSVAASDAACTDHGSATHATDASAQSHTMAMPAAHEGHHGAAADAHDGARVQASDASCSTPVQPRCCESMSSCSLSCVVGVRTAQPGAVQLVALAVSMPTRAPAFTLAAPEPPPPKA